MELLSVLPRRPAEFLDRVRMIAESKWEVRRPAAPNYQIVSEESAITLVSTNGHGGLASQFLDPMLLEIRHQVEQGIRDLPANAPFPFMHHGDALLARWCYAIASALVPRTVVETGVCYGVTSAHLLQALLKNNLGHLHSLDLPPLGKNGEDFVGRLVPAQLRRRWTLHRGLSGKLLRPLLETIGPIDMFVHDSLHTYRTMSNEFALAWLALSPGGALIADDVEGNAAFLQLSEQADVAFSVVIREESKRALLGIAGKKK